MWSETPDGGHLRSTITAYASCHIRSGSQTTGLTLTRCALDLYEKEGCEQHEYSLSRHRFTVRSVEGHTQVNLSGLSELTREEGGRILIAHMRDIKESAGTRQLDR